MKYFKEETLNEHLDIKICSEESEYCNDAPIQEDYEFDDKDELWFRHRLDELSLVVWYYNLFF